MNVYLLILIMMCGAGLFLIALIAGLSAIRQAILDSLTSNPKDCSNGQCGCKRKKKELDELDNKLDK